VTDTATKPTAFDNAITNSPESTVDEVIHALRNRDRKGVLSYLNYAGARSRCKELDDDVRDNWKAKVEAINKYLKERDHGNKERDHGNQGTRN